MLVAGTELHCLVKRRAWRRLPGDQCYRGKVSQRKWVLERRFVITAEEALQFAVLPSWRRGSRCVCVSSSSPSMKPLSDSRRSQVQPPVITWYWGFTIAKTQVMSSILLVKVLIICGGVGILLINKNFLLRQIHSFVVMFLHGTPTSRISHLIYKLI